MKQIKLVIWDLDDTFWNGTLSEGSVSYSNTNHNIVIELSRRGIMNSISSKNNFADAKNFLEHHKIWEYFVFPKIEWQPKGQLISYIIKEMQLRTENVLFIDDNPANLEEAKYYNPGLQTAQPAILRSILKLEACQGKNDSSLSRLKHYKILEKKVSDQKAIQCSNEDFLRNSQIEVDIIADCLPEIDRILELINRTNQLNYTKKRLTREQLYSLLQDPDIKKAYIRVRDKYGDYGICGFYATANSRALHFLFSCRILNMGIETWLYHKLGCPEIDIVGETATVLTTDRVPDWICEKTIDTKHTSEKAEQQGHGELSIIMKGGCDLLQIKNYLLKGSYLDAEVEYVSSNGYRINNAHSEILKRSNPATLEKYGNIIDKLLFFDRNAFKTNFFSNNYRVHIYSVLEDYTLGLYRYQDTEFVVPFGDFSQNLTDRTTWDYHCNRSAKHRMNRTFLEWFEKNFTYTGCIDPESFKQNIIWICGKIRKNQLLIILNGSEVVYQRFPQNKRWEHHKKMNAVLADAVKNMSHVVVCNVNEFVQTPADHSHNIRHYSRRIYFFIAKRLNEIIEQQCNIPYNNLEKQLHFIKLCLQISGQCISKRFIKRLVT